MSTEQKNWGKKVGLSLTAVVVVILLIIAGAFIRDRVQQQTVQQNLHGFYLNGKTVVEVNGESRTTFFESNSTVKEFAVNGNHVLTREETGQLTLTATEDQSMQQVPLFCSTQGAVHLNSVGTDMFMFLETCDPDVDEDAQYLTTVTSQNVVHRYPVTDVNALMVDKISGEVVYQNSETDLVSLQTVDVDTGEWADISPTLDLFGFLGGFYTNQAGHLIAWGTTVDVSTYQGYDYSTKKLTNLTLPSVDNLLTEVAFQTVMTPDLVWAVTVQNEDKTHKQLLLKDAVQGSSIFYDLEEKGYQLSGMIGINPDNTLLSLPVTNENGVHSNLILDAETGKDVTVLSNANPFVFSDQK
jgi:hypothetical protein